MLKLNGNVGSFSIVSKAKFMAGINPVKSNPPSWDINTPRRRVVFAFASIANEKRTVMIAVITIIIPVISRS